MSLDLVRSDLRTVDRAADDAAVAGIMMRLSGQYVLRVFRPLKNAYGDIRGALLMQAIDTANVAALVHSAEGRRAAGPGGSFPDEVRRPVSIARLADSAGVPFESTRRIVQRLVESGACVRVGGGVIVPRASSERPSTLRCTIANLGHIRRFAHDLEAAGLLDDDRPSWWRGAEGSDEDVAVARRVGPLCNEYILRALQLLAETWGDVRSGIIVQMIVTSNTAHLDSRMGEERRYASIDEAPSDELRRPITVSRLAELLGLAFETMRGQVQRLIDAGVCTRIEGGVIVPRAALETPAATRAALVNVGYVRKLLRDLHAVGP